jgi:hypothetical protein
MLRTSIAARGRSRLSLQEGADVGREGRNASHPPPVPPSLLYSSYTERGDHNETLRLLYAASSNKARGVVHKESAVPLAKERQRRVATLVRFFQLLSAAALATIFYRNLWSLGHAPTETADIGGGDSFSSSSSVGTSAPLPDPWPAVPASLLLDSELPKQPCDWCRAWPFHIWCKGWGGKGCAEKFAGAANSCEPYWRELQLQCGRTRGTTRCSMRCLHAVANTPLRCSNSSSASMRTRLALPVATLLDVATIAAKCRLKASRKWGATTLSSLSITTPPPEPPAPASLPLLVVFAHFQKTGGWSLVDYARRVGLQCPPSSTSCKPAHSEDEAALLRGDQHVQRAVLSAYASAFDFLHLEQTLNADPYFMPELRYVTILRHPIRRLLSHFRMGTRDVEIPGFWSGCPFKRTVALREFATQPISDCPICKASRQGSVIKDAQKAHGGVDFRHCCRKQWRYAADNYLIRELTGAHNLEVLGWGEVNQRHFEQAESALSKMDVVLLTEELHRAPEILHRQLGWPLLPMATLNPGLKKSGDGSNNSTTTRPLELEPEIAADKEVLALLNARNRLDLELYSRARQAFDRRLFLLA